MLTQTNVPTQAKILVGKARASELLSVCPRTIDNLVQVGEWPVVRIGRRVLFRLADLESFARRRTHGTGRGDTHGDGEEVANS